MAAREHDHEHNDKSALHPHVHDEHGRVHNVHPHVHDEHGRVHNVHPHVHDEHGHGHVHDEHGAYTERRASLPQGAGVSKILFLDAPSGLSGDMTVAALVDLGVPTSVIEAAIAALPIDGFHLHFGIRTRSGIAATSFNVHVERKQPERTYAEVCSILDRAELPPNVKGRAHATFRKLAEAEAFVHRRSLEEVHFHEVGAVDALVDIVASAAALEYLGARVVVSPLPMGRGFVKARHGILPLPAPAVLPCLAGFPTYDGGLDFEFVTPTGAAIVAAHAVGAERWPAIVPERIGWGAGTADLPDRANLLRAVLGAPTPEWKPAGANVHAVSHTVIETNIDDASGELLAVCIDHLLEAGALDAWATPITMKKGRPAFTLSALAPLDRADTLAALMLRESTSLGVRFYNVTRMERPRRFVDVMTPYGTIPIKVGEGAFGPPHIKPEFDACMQAARTHGVPLREVMRAAIAAFVG